MNDSDSNSRRQFLRALGASSGVTAMGVLLSESRGSSKNPPTGNDLWSFDHRVSTVRNLQETAPSREASALVEGYYKPGDGGGGIFYFDADGNPKDADGGLALAPSSGASAPSGIWRRLHTGDAVNARWFGAQPDPSTNQMSALQSAVDAASATTGILFIPQGTYGVAGKLTLPSGLTLEGAGMGTTTLRVLPEAPGVERTLRARGTPNDYVSNVTVRNLTVDGNRSNLTRLASDEEVHSTIYFIYVENILFERVEALNAQGAGFRIGATKSPYPARNVTLRDCRAVGNFQNGVAPTLVDTFLMEGCYVADTELVVSVDFETHGPMDVKRNCTVRDCKFEGQGVNWLGPIPNDPEQYRNLTIVNCTFVDVERPINVQNIRGCQIANNTILQTDASLAPNPSIYIIPKEVSTQGIVITGNEIRDPTSMQSAAIYVGNTKGAVISENQIEGGEVGIRLISASNDTLISGNTIRNIDEHGIAGKFQMAYSRILDNSIVDDRSPPRLTNGIYHSKNNQSYPVVVSRNVIRGAQNAINLDDSSAKQDNPWIISDNLIY